MGKRDVLVVGAGPTALAIGAPLRRLGVPAVILGAGRCRRGVLAGSL
jgi:cation diffusion facilitator CzcD-associated flavoprotein CzcO